MPKLTELYKRLADLEEEIEEAVEWVEEYGADAEARVQVSTMSEGRSHHVPYWMLQKLTGCFRSTLLANIRTIIEDKVREKTNIEVEFIQEVSRDKIKADVKGPLDRVDAVIQRGVE